MRQFLAFACIFFLLSSCSQNSKEDLTLSDLVPDNSAVILKATSLETLESDIKNNGFISLLTSKKLLDSIKNKYNKFEDLDLKNEAIICISDDYNLSIISTKNEDLVRIDSLQPQLGNLYKTEVDSLLIASTSKSIIDEISSQKTRPNPYLKKLLNTSNVESSVSILINTEVATNLLDSILESGGAHTNCG